MVYELFVDWEKFLIFFSNLFNVGELEVVGLWMRKLFMDVYLLFVIRLKYINEILVGIMIVKRNNWLICCKKFINSLW